MLIDWFTVGAQALNFLILVWLMKRFLYKPILQAIDAREKLIAKELADAAAMKSEAGKERDAYNHKSEAFDHDRAALLTHAVDEAKTERQRLLDEARTAADAMSAKRLDLLQSEVRDLYASISRRTQDEVFAIARKALKDLADASLEEHLASAFARRLRDLHEPARTNLCNAMRSAHDPALIRSAFDLPAAQHAALQETINVLCSSDIHLRFETAPEVIGGIELTSSGNKVSWSLAEYLQSLEKAIEDLLQKQVRQAPTAASGADSQAGKAPAHEDNSVPVAAAGPASQTPASPTGADAGHVAPASAPTGTAANAPISPVAPAAPVPSESPSPMPKPIPA